LTFPAPPCRWISRDALAERSCVGGDRATTWHSALEGNDRARRFYERAGWRGDDGMKPFGLYEVRYRKQV